MQDPLNPDNLTTERLKAQLRALQQENTLLNEKLAAALDGTNLCIWQGAIQSGELTVFNLQNFAQGQMAPHFDLWLAKLHPDDRDAALSSYYEHLSGKSDFYQAEYRVFRPDGEITWLWDRGRVVEWDEQGLPLRMIGSHLDITDRKEFELRLANLAHHDTLTDLANRRLLMNLLKQETERAERHNQSFVVAMLDVDHFKRFNDEHGHEIGDRILIAIARHMESALREYDICGRWGGEEFLLLLPQTREQDAWDVVCRLHQSIQQVCIQTDTQSLFVTVSIGIAEHLVGESYAETLRRADSAMLEAKRSGRNCLLRA